MTQKLITDYQLDGIAGSKVSGAVALATTVTTNANLSGDVTSVGNTTTLGTVPVAKGGSGQTTANDALNAFLPSQATNNGKVLGTDGTNTSWVTAGGGSGTVTSVSVATANGVSGSVANATTTPAITLTLGAITPSSVAATGTVTGTNLSGTNTGDQTITLTGDVTGSGTGSFATTLATVPATKGGTGQTTITTGDVLYGSATNTISKLGIGSAGQVLTVAGGVPTWAAAGGGGGVTWATYTGSSAAPTITAGSKSLGLNFGAGTNTITTSATVGSFYAGSGINVSAGTADRNIVFFTGNSGSGGDTTGATMTLSNNNVNNIILCTGVQANTAYTTSEFVLIGNRGPAAPGANSVGIGSFANVGGNAGAYSVCIGPNTIAKAAGSIALGNGARVSGANAASTISIGASSTIGDFNSYVTLIGPGTVVPAQSSPTERSYSIFIGNHNNPGTGSTYSENSTFIGRMCATDTTATPSNCVAIGRAAKTEFNSEMVFTGGTLAGAGTVKSSTIVSFMQTTTATPTEIGQPDVNTGQSLAPTGRLNLTNDSSYIFDCDIIARNTATDTETSGWNLKFVIRRGTNAASTTIVGTAIKTVLAQDTGTTTWDVGVSADTTNGRPKIEVTGQAAKTIRWVVNTRLTKVSG